MIKVRSLGQRPSCQYSVRNCPIQRQAGKTRAGNTTVRPARSACARASMPFTIRSRTDIIAMRHDAHGQACKNAGLTSGRRATCCKTPRMQILATSSIQKTPREKQLHICSIHQRKCFKQRSCHQSLKAPTFCCSLPYPNPPAGDPIQQRPGNKPAVSTA